MTTPDPAAPAPLPVGTSEQAAEISAARIALLMILADGTSVIGTPGDHAAIDRLLRAQHAATLAHLAAQAPDGVEELVYRLTDAVADVVDNPAGPYRIAAQVRRDEAKSALLAAFTALTQRAEAAEAAQRRAEGALREISARQWEAFQPGDDTGATLPYPAVVRCINIARIALAPRGASEGEEA